ncbi:HAD family hydrolase [Glycomyces xiaoerkulensis]|uniref:HAD family hydrolase n=1 Tax=Glycomyces xiaoerkulensis TaxID=2038139 RepID=UPI000C25C9B5|nr:HAD family hydrolase [Glycomyces xiaoerkulensis]
MHDCRVIATDLDGTLLDRRRLLSERNRKALMAARARGLTVVAVTARTPRGLAAVDGLTGAVDAAICNNGAILFEPGTDRIEVRHTIDFSTVTELHRRLRNVLPQASFAIETGGAVLAQSAHVPAGPHYDDPWYRVDTLEEALAQADAVVEYRVLDRATGGPGMLRAAGDVMVPGVVRWSWGRFPVLEYNAEAVNKGDALAAWCAEWDIGPESVVAFGDMPADAPMLAWAGRSYAVAGAQPEAVAAADRWAGPNDDDGVAEAIEAILEESGPPGS